MNSLNKKTIVSILRFIFFAFFTLSFAQACVSVNLKPKAAAKSKAYQFVAPFSPFQRIDSDQVDHAWQNSKTGNTIAVLSECSENRDPGLSTIENETIEALSNPHILHTENIQFNDRGALSTLVEGELDGVKVKMEVLTLKKNSCAYTLSYIGRSTNFERDKKLFDQYLKGFLIP